jgi:uncharacterized repeat protein (TIGR01451 family)
MMLQKRYGTHTVSQLALGASVLVILVIFFTLVAIAEDCGKDPDLWFPLPGTSLDGGLSVQEASPSIVCQGGTIYITVTVDNLTCGDAAPFDVSLYYNQIDTAHLIGTQRVEEGLEACEHIVLEFTWETEDVTPGDHTIIVIADPDEEVTEMNEGNNEYTLPIEVTIKPYTPVIDASKTYSDLNEGNIEPDDTISYTVVITNEGCADQLNNDGHEFSDSLPEWLYATGQVDESSGKAVVEQDSIYWDGVIPAGGSVTITFVAKVISEIEDGQVVCNQGYVHWDTDNDEQNDSDEPTDDPSTAIDDDPTCFTIVISDEPAMVGTIDAPTLSQWAQITMSVLLALAFVTMIIKRRMASDAK